MQRFAWKSIAIAIFVCGMACELSACANDGVGDPCVPESIPCDDDKSKGCGFSKSESYVESSSVQCRSRVCIVHKLVGGAELADPRDIEGQDEGIARPGIDGPNSVDKAALDQSVYCTCRCKNGDGKKIEGCECADGFECEEILTLGGDGIRGFYCVRPEKD